MAVPSPSPVRYPSGIALDYPWQWLANFGGVNPAKYHSFFDDFNFLNAALTATVTAAGTIAAAAGDGGRLLFTTDALVGDYCAISPPVAGFALTAGKKAFFGARLRLSSASLAAIRLGFQAVTTTPFSAPVNGVYFNKATASSVVTLTNMAASVATTGTVPATSFAIADATDIDFGFAIDRNGDILGWVGPDLVGWLPATGQTVDTTAKGPSVRVSPAALPSVNMMPIIGVQSGSATAKTMQLDFMFAAVER